MPGRAAALMTEYRRSYQPSQFRCAATTYFNNREFRLQQLQRFQQHAPDPFVWPDDDVDDDDECRNDDGTTGCDDEGGSRGRRALFEPAHQYRHRQLKSLYERRARSIEAQDTDRQPECHSERKDCSSRGSRDSQNDSRCSSSSEDDDRSSVVHVVGSTQCDYCTENKQTQTPQCWSPGEKPPFALYGHRYDEKETGMKMTHNVRASHEISPSALRAKQLRQLDKTCVNPPVTSASLRRVDHTTPVLVPAEDDRLPHNSAWTSEYEREFRPYERSRYHAHVDGAARRLHRDLKPSAPHTHRSYLMTY